MWSDRETKDDCLGFASYVEVLAEICLERDIAPLTLGIFGSWGCGKTSLMQMLRKNIEEGTAEKEVKTLWVNAWRYEGREEAQSALVHAILEKLSEDKTLWEDVKDTAKRLKDGASVLKLGKFIGKSLMTMTPDIGEFLDSFSDQSDKVAESMAGFERDFTELLDKMVLPQNSWVVVKGQGVRFG